jgi:nucleoside-diphosphate-sugar epimerase
VARILIAGCGYVGAALGEALAQDGEEVWGLRRRTAGLPERIRPLEADLGLPRSLRGLPPDLDFVLFMAAPGGGDDALYRAVYVEGLRNLLTALDEQKQRPRRVIFVSSTSVYGQSRGEWVDESSPTEPTRFSGRRLLEAEDLLDASVFASTALRFGGIYGPRRTSLIERVRTGRAVYRRHPPQYTNRIHRDDCVGSLRHLMRLEAPEKLYLGVDCDPADEAAVLNWLAGALGAPSPRATDGDTGRASGSNKRCRNGRLLASGYSFVHPTFREGYTALLAEAP